MILRVLVYTMLLLAASSGPVWAQGAQPGPPPGGGMMGGMPMMGMMCPMMGGGGMMGGMMPMPGAGPADSPRMLQMRGEMLKAMGEILMKYGKMMEGGARP